MFLMLIGAGIFWAIKNGQFEDMEGPAQRILMDDDDPLLPDRDRAADTLNKAP